MACPPADLSRLPWGVKASLMSRLRESVRSCKQQSHGTGPWLHYLSKFSRLRGVHADTPSASGLLGVPVERRFRRALRRDRERFRLVAVLVGRMHRVAARPQLHEHVRTARRRAQHLAVMRVDDPHMDVGEKVRARPREAQRQRPLALRLLQRLRLVETDAARDERNVALLLDLRQTSAVDVACARLVGGGATGYVARLLRVRAAHQTESERHAGRGGYDLSLSALVFHRFAPY